MLASVQEFNCVEPKNVGLKVSDSQIRHQLKPLR